MKNWTARSAIIVEHPLLSSAAIGVTADNAASVLEEAGFVVLAVETRCYEVPENDPKPSE